MPRLPPCRHPKRTTSPPLSLSRSCPHLYTRVKKHKIMEQETQEIVLGDTKHDARPEQLRQRWSIIEVSRLAHDSLRRINHQHNLRRVINGYASASALAHAPCRKDLKNVLVVQLPSQNGGLHQVDVAQGTRHGAHDEAISPREHTRSVSHRDVRNKLDGKSDTIVGDRSSTTRQQIIDGSPGH